MDIPAIWALAKPIVEGQIRTYMATAGGALVASGAISVGDEASFIKIGTGIAMAAIPAAWSWWDKIGRARLLAFVAKTHNAVAPASATTGQAVVAAQAAAKEAGK